MSRRNVRAALLASLLAGAASLAGCAVPPGQTAATGGATAAAASFTAVPYSQVPGWNQDHPAQAMPAMLLTCARLQLSPPDTALGGSGTAAALGGQAGLWGRVCADAKAVPPGDDAAARGFFERDLQAYAIGAGGGQALFTGYYEPEVAGSRTRTGSYQTPLLGRPNDLVQADLGDFSPSLKGTTVSGRVTDGRMVPYYDRGDIDRGALDRQRLPLLWLSSPVDLFFLQIQGSGRVRLPNGQVVRVAYAAKNGRPYVAIGKLLSDRGDIPADQVTMQSVRAWLVAHPAEGRQVMEENPSYVFFRLLDNVDPNQGPPGALGVPLTPGRSLAVDRKTLPLGAPVFIATTDPLDGSAMQKLMMAQDLGSAIDGPLRGDIFFGWGPDAEARAGRMQGRGSAFVLLPKAPAG